MSDCLIDPVRLSALLGAGRGRFDVVALPECDSTNAVLLQQSASAPSGRVIVADRQTAGRGRRGRVWHSAPADTLTFSLLWRLANEPARIAGLSLAVGVAVAQALEHCGVAGVALKWPNDVLLGASGAGKLGGILIELASDRAATAAIIGIGLNLHQPPAADGFGLPAAALDAAGPVPERHVLLAALLDALACTLDRFVAGGFAAVRDDWQSRHVWQERPVRLLGDSTTTDSAVVEGRCLGADSDGALLLALPDGRIERYLVGDVSLRAA
ncbi:biotin--[acetyl-CoA-carboxylase] ligase [Rhodocyclus tenuis]|uniref:biotin--[biotin carboxyl-carrier protein] ligase n=1 Tax=Rhodocyclus tenuis TaxID=1066 RepID=A0A6L5JYQ6_RHOTE|nr:biotin--[acetyl-CoA-carboxylase] ligase [Rhodocyclus gracilis]MQY52206.1 biotin--[acetyl-CoA-carboxylase] ligase [Rhodocyclus gracilis]MRD72364.1 biotin--[acetyl-CoA-carboxylase] ligase [Rhodocyclus gracilis]